MDKEAQQRSFFSKVRDTLNIGGRILEEVNIEFATIMGKLRESDADIREKATDLKQLATNAVKLVRARHYMDVAVNVSAFHERVRFIAAKMERFNSSVDLRHYSYLLDQLPEQEKEKLFSYDPSKKITLDAEAADYSFALTKQAAFTDWFFQAENAEPNSKQNTAMKSLENRFKIPLLKNLKAQSISMTERTYQFYKYMLLTFKKLGWAVATRKVDKYVEISNDFIRKFAEYHNHFVKYYETNILPLKQQQDKMKADQEAKTYAERANMAQEFQDRAQNYTGNSDMSMAPGPAESLQTHFQAPSLPTQEEKAKVLDQLPSDENKDNIPINLTTPKQPQPQEQKTKPRPMNLRDRPATAAFISTLEKLASEDQAEELLSMILKQSAELEGVDADKSLQLFAIAEGMIEDYKTAGILDFWKKKDEEDALEDAPGLPLPQNQK